MSREFELLLACARARSSPEGVLSLQALSRGDVDWEAVVRLARPHGMLPVVFQQMSAHAPDAMPAAVAVALRGLVLGIVDTNLLLLSELARLQRDFDTADIQSLSFKGPALAAVAYQDLSSRQFLDVDILIPRTAIARAVVVLESAGYSCEQRRILPRFTHEMLFVHRTSGAKVDLHWDIQTPLLAVPFDTAALFERGSNVAIAGRSLRTLSHEDHFLLLCVHGSKHLWDRFAQICDVAEFVNRCPDLDWSLVIALAGRARSRRMVHVALLLAATLLGARVPSGLLAQARADSAVRSLAARILERLPRENPRESDEWRKVAFYLTSRERVRDRWTYLVRSLTTPTHAEAAVPMPHVLRYPFRPVRLVLKYLAQAVVRKH